jgi:histone deacetylase 6
MRATGRYGASNTMCTDISVTTIEDSPAVFTIPNLLKLHRSHHLYEKHGLHQVPLASLELEAAFGGQVICK